MFNPLAIVISALSINIYTRSTEGLSMKGEKRTCKENQGKKKKKFIS